MIDLKQYIKDTEINLKKAQEMLETKGYDMTILSEYIKEALYENFVLLIGGGQIGGSLSPFMHTYSALKNDKNMLYVLLNMEKEGLDVQAVLDYIVSSPKVLGANVTMPYKQDVYKILKAKSQLDGSGIIVGAVNTLSKDQEGKLRGYNTDMEGISKPISREMDNELGDVDIAYVLGCGGAAKAAIAGLLSIGITRIVVLNRTCNKLLELINHFNSDEVQENLSRIYGISDYKIVGCEYDLQYGDKDSILVHMGIDQKSILVNTLPFGFKSHLPSMSIKSTEIEKVMQNVILCFDVVYDMNTSTTPLIAKVRSNWPDIKVCDGRDMVIDQARKGFNLRTGAEMDLDELSKMLR